MCGAVEEPLTAADRSLGGVTQGLARCVEAESVKSVALRQKVQLRVKKYDLVLLQINQKTARSQGRPRPLAGHDTPNPAYNTYTLKCEESGPF